jgi:hypothetical protein
MSTPGHAESKVVRLNMPRTGSSAARRPVKLTEEERQILLAELAEVTAELNWLQGRTLDLASRVLNTSGTEEARTA